ncbi:MAG: GNAT family N-acetyltransferase, partial [Lachnospirales bacterium]
SKGIGKELLSYVKSRHNKLDLKVYDKNKRAINFYLKEGFIIIREEIDENNNEIELRMKWKI